METFIMKSFTASIIMLLAVTLVLAGVLVAGCTQSSNTAAPASNNQQATPAGTYSGNASYGNHQYFGQRFLTNTTLLNAAAAQLGVSEQALQSALTPQSGQRMNLTSAAAQLGVTPQQLQAALGFPAGGYQSSGQGFLSNTTLLNAAAAQLGVSEQALQNALTPQSGQRMNLTNAAAQLGVTPQQLQAALGFPAGGYQGNHAMPMMTPTSGQ
jgi:hypothetical protein